MGFESSVMIFAFLVDDILNLSVTCRTIFYCILHNPL
jgi:hypothetical protein